MPSYAPFYDPKAKHFEKNSVAELTKAYAVCVSSIPHLHIHSTVYSIAKICSWLVIRVLGLSRHLLSHFHTTLTFPTSTPSRYLTAATIFRGNISSREVSGSDYAQVRTWWHSLCFAQAEVCTLFSVGSCSVWTGRSTLAVFIIALAYFCLRRPFLAFVPALWNSCST